MNEKDIFLQLIEKSKEIKKQIINKDYMVIVFVEEDRYLTDKEKKELINEYDYNWEVVTIPKKMDNYAGLKNLSYELFDLDLQTDLMIDYVFISNFQLLLRDLMEYTRERDDLEFKIMLEEKIY